MSELAILQRRAVLIPVEPYLSRWRKPRLRVTNWQMTQRLVNLKLLLNQALDRYRYFTSAAEVFSRQYRNIADALRA